MKKPKRPAKRPVRRIPLPKQAEKVIPNKKKPTRKRLKKDTLKESLAVDRLLEVSIDGLLYGH
jgi:hypothetical protein